MARHYMRRRFSEWWLSLAGGGLIATLTGPITGEQYSGGRMDPSQNPNVFHATTICCVRRGEHVAMLAMVRSPWAIR